MKDTARQEEIEGESYDYSEDFTVLTPVEKREVLKTAKNFLKLLKDNDLLPNVPVPSMEAKKTGLS
jgi:hypothetical protein